jgi:hypothetical protein
LLIPVYIVGFILGGLLCFAIAQRVPYRPVKICLRTIGVLAGPIFFLVVAVFSSQEREKAYEMEWLTGKPAAEYCMQIYKGHVDPPDPETIVMLRRNIGNNRVCFESLHSKELAHYLESLPTHRVKVTYRVIYDFYQLRAIGPQTVGDFGDNPGVNMKKMWTGDVGLRGPGPLNVYESWEPCFPW